MTENLNWKAGSAGWPRDSVYGCLMPECKWHRISPFELPWIVDGTTAADRDVLSGTAVRDHVASTSRTAGIVHIVRDVRLLLLVRVHRALIVRTVCIRSRWVVGAGRHLGISIVWVAVTLRRRLLVHGGRFAVVGLVASSTGITVIGDGTSIHTRLIWVMISLCKLLKSWKEMFVLFFYFSN